MKLTPLITLHVTLFATLLGSLIFPVNAEPDFLNSVIERLDKTSSHIDGPNCWNGAMYASGIVSSLRFMHPDEWLYHIEKNCEQVDRPIQGDLGRIFHPVDGEVHGFIHLDNETIFAKHGENTMHGYQVMSYEEMMNQYGKRRSCKIDRSNDPDCFHEVVYYRCTKNSKENSFTELGKILENVSFSPETEWSYRSDCQSDNFLKREELLNEALLLKEKLVEDLEKMKAEKALLAALFKSFRTQIYNIEVSNRNYKCKPRSLKYSTIKAVRDMVSELNDSL